MSNMPLQVMGHVKHIHFVGIGGAGMSGIAEVLQNIGYAVSGSDLKHSSTTERLASLGVNISIGHSVDNIGHADVVVVTSAVDEMNEELLAARNQRIPVVRRAEMLAELMRFSQGIAIAGTHGKTTTTSLVASVLAEGGLDPTYVIGGLLNSSGSNARFGSGNYIVAEADESDASFLHLHPIIAVITNIDVEHLVSYDGDFAKLQHSFIEFLHQLPFYGAAVLCVDDVGIRTILPQVTKPVITYGVDFEADYQAKLLRQEQTKSWFLVSHKDQKDWLEIELNLPGKHNVQNALASIVIAHELGICDDKIVSALKNFQGIARRCHVHGDIQINNMPVTLLDDYAHHPTEIEATFNAIRAGWPNRRLLVIYQPHRYTRMRDLFEDFSQTLSQADNLLILEVYAAHEALITGADSRSLCRAIRLRGQVDPIFIEKKETIFAVLEGLVQPHDLLLTLGAGDIGAMSKQLYEHYS